MSRSFYILVGIFVLAWTMHSCFKNVDFPDEPQISEPEFYLLGDSAQLSFSFTDGDADIGLNDDELDPPYDSTSKYYYNLYVEYFEKDDALGWVPGIDLAGDTVVFKYRLHRIEVKGKERGIKGTMDIIMNPFFNPVSDQSDTIKYRIQLIDRALNESNMLETGTIVHGL